MSDQNTCPDCGAEPGSEHTSGCDVERCSACGGQWITCGCEGHDPSKSLWEGEWPGVAECRRRGWFCTDGHGPSRKYGSFRPCTADTPGAMEDLNRLVRFQRTGKDDLYDGLDDEVPDGR